MPSSLVFAALVVAWLAVLVPVVARRRQTVPRPAEAHLSARVLTRPDRSTTGSTARGTDTTETGRTQAGDRQAADQQTGETQAGDTQAGDTQAGDTQAGDTQAGTARADVPPGRVLDRGRSRRPFRDDAGEDEGMDERDDEGRLATVDRDGYDEYEPDDDAGYGADDGYDDGYGRDLDEAPDDDPDHRPRTYRPGRGGFDADAAAAAAHARYAFRQRVALGLIAVAVLSLLAALVVAPAMWWLHVVTDLGLVGYLVFLRRQTRIEDEVRRRRLARLTGERRALEARRDRQAEHEARLAETERWGAADDLDDGYDDDFARDADDDRAASDEQDHDGDEDSDDVDVPTPRWIAPRTPAPAVPDGMELVADTDEDPDFHDLSDERVPAYRRVAAGA